LRRREEEEVEEEGGGGGGGRKRWRRSRCGEEYDDEVAVKEREN
jgi:hypothetical protein